jgi:hypothetical protein
MTGSTVSRPLVLTLLLTAITFAEGCRAIEGIFKAGVWVGLIIAAIAVVVIVAIVRALGT